jgi:hypothetical protein
LNRDHWGPKTINHRNHVGGYRIDKKELISASVNFDHLKRKRVGGMFGLNSPNGGSSMRNSLDSPNKFFM